MNKNEPKKIKELLKIEESSPTEREGETVWRLPDGTIHRQHGPARIREDGLEQWFLYGRLHREDGPANINPEHHEEWYLEGKLHRIGGPASKYIMSDGGIVQEWWENGIRITKNCNK